MRVTSTIVMRRACPSCSTSTAVGRFHTNPPPGTRTTSARDRGVTVTSSTVTGSADASRAPSLSMTDRMHTFLLVFGQPGPAATPTASARQISPSGALAPITSWLTPRRPSLPARVGAPACGAQDAASPITSDLLTPRGGLTVAGIEQNVDWRPHDAAEPHCYGELVFLAGRADVVSRSASVGDSDR